MKNSLLFLLTLLCFQLKAQERCDCCNYYLTGDQQLWESFFAPSLIRKNKTTTATLDYSFIDSIGKQRTEPILIFSFNSKGYVIEVTEYFDGLPNHTTKYTRTLRNRIKMSRMQYLDEQGKIIPDFLETITDYSYSRKGTKVKERSYTGEIVPDSVANNFYILKYNRDGLLTESFSQYHFETGGEEGVYHDETKRKIEMSKDGRSATYRSYSNDTLNSIEIIELNNDNLITKSNYFNASDTSQAIFVKEFEYNSDGQYVLMKNSNPVDLIYSECADLGNYELHLDYKDGLLESISYQFSNNERIITCSFE